MRNCVLLISLLAVTPCFAQKPSDTGIPLKRCPGPTLTQNVQVNKDEAPAGTADLHSVIASVQAAVKCYQDSIGSGPDSLPPLEKAVFDFQTTRGKVGGIEVDFFIFKIKASHENDLTHQTTFTYTRPKPTTVDGHPLRTKKPPLFLTDDMVARMQAAGTAVKDAAQMGDLKFNQLDMKIQFGIKFEGNVAINAPVELVTLGPSIDYNKNDVQTVTFTFAPPQ